MAVVTGIVQGPICGAILTLANDWLGMAGWRWLFLIQAVPAVALGIITPFVLVTKLEKIKFLDKDDKEWLINTKRGEATERLAASNDNKSVSRWNVLKMPVLWWISIAAFTCVMASYGITMWLPLTFQKMGEGLSIMTITLLTVIPYLFGAIVGLINGWHSDKTQERRFHVAVPLLVLCISLVVASTSDSLLLTIICMSVAIAGFVSFNGTVFAIPTSVMGEAAAVIGVAIINLIMNLGGFVGPVIIGYSESITGSPAIGLAIFGVATFIGFIITLIIAKPKKNDNAKALSQ
jgi:ACS family tartrate transporter-like MFS transporter